METVLASGLVVETRSAWDADPNGNDPADVPPATVGPDVAQPGDPDGFEIIDGGAGGLIPRSRIVPSPWDGWPAGWATPAWNARLDQLTDTAWACLDLNSSVLATMPPYIVGTPVPAPWMENPDPEHYVSWNAFAKELFWEYQLGEAFVMATAYDDGGRPARFHVVPGWMVNVEMTPEGRRYTLGSLDITADVLHIAYKMQVGEAHGHGPLEAGAGRVVAARALARYASNFAAAGAVPNSVLKHPGNLTAEQANELKWQWVEARTNAMGLPAVLSGGVEFETIQLSPADMALLDLSQFNEARIAVLLGVPPLLVALPSGGDPLTYTNTQWIFVFHWRAGLSPKASAVMSALSAWALPPGTGAELNRDEYTKPELKERAETWAILNSIHDTEGRPVLSRDEIRQLERYSNAAPTPTLTSGVLQ